MWRAPLLVIAIAMTSAAQRANLEFRSQYAEPYIQRYRIDAQLSIAARDQIIDATAAERVLDEILTPSVRKALLPGIESITGRLGQSTRTYGRMMVTRSYWADGSEGSLLGYSVSWR